MTQKKECSVFFARNLSELFYHMKTIAGLKIVGGCTRISEMPKAAVSVRTVTELRMIAKHERYISFGPAATLSEILALGEHNVPKILYEAVKSTANPMVRNLATLGGNVCADGQKLTLYAPLLALDATLEIRRGSDTFYIPILNFTQVPANSVLTNIRVPLNDWDVAVFRRLGPDHKITERSASFAFLADTEKNIITSVRLAFAGTVLFRSLELENRLLGARLPLSERDIAFFTEIAGAQFEKKAAAACSPVLRQQFLNLAHYSFEQLT